MTRGQQVLLEIGDSVEAVALAGEAKAVAGLRQIDQPDEVGDGLRDLVEQVDRVVLLRLEHRDRRELLLEQPLLGLELGDLLSDHLELRLAGLGLRGLRVQLGDRAGLEVPADGADADGANHEDAEHQIELRGTGHPRRLLLRRSAFGFEKVYPDHRSLTFRTASPTAIAAEAPTSSMNSASKSFGLYVMALKGFMSSTLVSRRSATSSGSP